MKKEKSLELEQKLFSIAASYVLCNNDISEVIELLENAEGEDLPDEIVVWERFEDIQTISELYNEIKDIIVLLKEARALDL